MAVPGVHDTYDLKVVRYVDADGEPTCAADFSKASVCPFYATQRFGQSESCWFADKERGRYWEPLSRRKDGRGSLIPLEQCPLWKK